MAGGSAPQLVGLTFRPGGRASWFGPLTAAFAGALAARGLSVDGGTLVALGLVAVLVDPVMGGLWSAVTGSGWRQRWADAAGAERAARLLPHTVVGSAAHAAGGWLARATAPQLVDAVASCVAFLACGLVLAVAVGPWAVALTVVGVAVSLAAAAAGPCSLVTAWLEALYFFGLAWALGFVAATGAGSTVGQAPVVAMAAAWLVVYWGYRQLCAGGGSGALAALNGGQAAAVILLAAWGRPWLAGIVALLLAAQALGQPGNASHDAPAYARRSLIFLTPALLVSFL